MALPKQLQSARMTDATLAKFIDDKVGELEVALCDILGFTVNTDITESPVSFDNAGRITKALLRLVAAAPVGVRFRDSTNSKEFRLALSNTSIMLDENTGSESSPSWNNRITFALATGLPTLAAATDPSAANDLARKGYVDSAIDADISVHAGAATSHADATNLVHVTGAETVGGVKTFSSIPVLPASDPTTSNQAVRKAYVDTYFVKLSGDQTVAGVKTFSSIPVLPASNPTTDNQAARKKYVDDSITALGLPNPIVILQHWEPSGTHAGGQNAGTWDTRTLNREALDTGGICTLSSNQFTLPAGTYDIEGDFCYYYSNHGRLRLYNVSDSGVQQNPNGHQILSNTVAMYNSGQNVQVNDRFVLTGSKTLRFESRVSYPNTIGGWGYATSMGVEERYAIVRITKVA